ncbi:MAG: lytic murein transglycosylase B [Xanthomonadales bacterium]|nr:lytic murein transglycosylase B [Xanthomonadales bacterium]
MNLKSLLSGLLLAGSLSPALGQEAVPAEPGLDALHPGSQAFVQSLVEQHGIERQMVERMLGEAQRRQDILDAISRPAEAKPWHQYRPIFLTEKRIGDGIAFWREHEALLTDVARRFGVPPEIVVAIIGVETNYGRITGRYRVIDALATLAFHYPPRSKFFTSELEQFFLLGSEEALDLNSVKGSYAGAMGLGQFISSSYRSYAVDYDGDGRRDLWQSHEDAIASVANYFKRHGWRTDGPVVSPASRQGLARELKKLPLKPAYPLMQIQEWGYRPEIQADGQELATLIELDGADGKEYWVGFHNFYVISRYNRSKLYSLAVYQLSQEILSRFQAGTAS